VIGGKNSSNTNRLFTTAQKLCAHAALIETATEIPEDFFNLESVGITAGASTPDSVIDAVESILLQGIKI
jgi:4-hydroxy-3-methylbut-2-enyl diphosphate reductase